MKPFFISRYLIFYGILCLSGPVFAGNDAAELHQKRITLARDFVFKLKDKLSGAESAPESTAAGATPSQSVVPISQIAEGETMLFRPRVGKYTLEGDIYAVKGPDDFYLSLSDFIAVLDFPIEFDEESQKASGWFVREDWRFELDVAAGTVRARDQDYQIDPAGYLLEGSDLMIASHLLGQWTDMTYEYDVSQQYIKIETDYILPGIARLARRDRTGSGRNRDNVAVLPRQDVDYDMASIASADLSLRSNYRRSGESGKGNLLNSASTGVSGQLLNHDARIFVNADDRDGLNSVSASLGRSSDRAELLGPLKARSYVMGDTSTVDIPLAGQTAQELGVRVSSNPLYNINFQDTRISGNALPGWDVELYRNDTLVDSLIVDETGRYEFDDVQLYAGDNEFDIYFYGYQGEVRRESLNIPLTPESLSAQNKTYDVSLTLNDTATYRRRVSEDDDYRTAHIAGKYNFYLGDTLAYAGLRGVQENGDQKLYLGTGFTNIWNGFILDGNLAADESAEAGARLGVRKNINDWNLALSTLAQTDNFSAGSGTDNPITFQTLASAYRSYTPPIGTSGSFSIDGQYREQADGASGHTASIGLGQGFQNVSLSNTVRFDENKSAIGDTTERVTNDFSARVRLNRKVSTRAGLSYVIRPESQMDRYFANVSYRPNPNLNLDFEVDHEPDIDHTEAELRANYTHEKYRLSPFVRVDSDRDLTAGFNLSTSLINDPQEGRPYVTSERIVGQGLLSARVYLDVNGNMFFDEGDEALPDVVVESLNSRAREKTEENGYAMLRRLSVNMPTDIRVDNSTLPDPFMLAALPGHAVLPRAGKVLEMDFPIHFAGEVDGTVGLINQDGTNTTAKFVEVQLIPLDQSRHKTITAKAAYDGFYILSQIPSGAYFLTVSEKDAKTLGAARAQPLFLQFTHEGTMFYSQNINLIKGRHDIGFEVLPPAEWAGYTGAQPDYFISFLKPGSSGLLQTLHRLRMKDIINKVAGGLEKIVLPEGDKTYYRVGAGGLAAAYQRCEMMSVNQLPCTVHVLAPDAANNRTVGEQASL